MQYPSIPPELAADFIRSLRLKFNEVPPERLNELNLEPATSTTFRRMCERCGVSQELRAHYRQIAPTLPWEGATKVPSLLGAPDRALVRDQRIDILSSAFKGFNDFSTVRRCHIPYDAICLRCRRTLEIVLYAERELGRLRGRLVRVDASGVREAMGQRSRGCVKCLAHNYPAALTDTKWKVYFLEDGALEAGVYCARHAREVYDERGLQRATARRSERLFVLERPL